MSFEDDEFECFETMYHAMPGQGPERRTCLYNSGSFSCIRPNSHCDMPSEENIYVEEEIHRCLHIPYALPGLECIHDPSTFLSNQKANFKNMKANHGGVRLIDGSHSGGIGQSISSQRTPCILYPIKEAYRGSSNVEAEETALNEGKDKMANEFHYAQDAVGPFEGDDGDQGLMAAKFHATDFEACRISRPPGSKDRHGKVLTSKGQRDRRIRLSLETAVKFYDVQDRLGLRQSSKAVEWLLQKSRAAIDDLPQISPTSFLTVHTGRPKKSTGIPYSGQGNEFHSNMQKEVSGRRYMRESSVFMKSPPQTSTTRRKSKALRPRGSAPVPKYYVTTKKDQQIGIRGLLNRSAAGSGRRKERRAEARDKARERTKLAKVSLNQKAAKISSLDQSLVERFRSRTFYSFQDNAAAGTLQHTLNESLEDNVKHHSSISQPKDFTSNVREEQELFHENASVISPRFESSPGILHASELLQCSPEASVRCYGNPQESSTVPSTDSFLPVLSSLSSAECEFPFIELCGLQSPQANYSHDYAYSLVLNCGSSTLANDYSPGLVESLTEGQASSMNLRVPQIIEENPQLKGVYGTSIIYDAV